MKTKRKYKNAMEWPISAIPEQDGRDLLSCPMKDGLRCCSGTPEIVCECNCRMCFRWNHFFNNPYDAFLSRIIKAHPKVKI